MPRAMVRLSAGREALGAAEHRCARTGVVVSRHDVDAPGSASLVRRYRPAVVPTFVFLDEQGRERTRLEGVQPQERIEQELARLVHAACALVPPPAAVPAHGGRG
jgi:thiol:disulfide interchange protein